VIHYGGSEREVDVATSFCGQVQCWGLMTCVLVAVLFASRSRRQTGGWGSAAQNSAAVQDRHEVCLWAKICFGCGFEIQVGYMFGHMQRLPRAEYFWVSGPPS
jgi:hypothetical protein